MHGNESVHSSTRSGKNLSTPPCSSMGTRGTSSKMTGSASRSAVTGKLLSSALAECCSPTVATGSPTQSELVATSFPFASFRAQSRLSKVESRSPNGLTQQCVRPFSLFNTTGHKNSRPEAAVFVCIILLILPLAQQLLQAGTFDCP